MARRAFPSRRSGRAVYRTPSQHWLRRRVRPPATLGVAAGSTTIAVSVALTAAGTKSAAGSSSIAVSVALTAAGTKSASGSCTITVDVSLSGSGTKSTGIGSIPRPRLRWQFIVGPAWGGHELALTEAKSRRFTARLTDPSELGFSLNGRHPQADAVRALSTDVHVLWTSDQGDTRILFRGRVGSKVDRLDTTEHTAEVAVLDYRAVLARRILYSGDLVTWTATEQAEIAWGLVAQTQSKTGGNLGISKGWAGAPTGVVRDRTYELGDSVGDRIKELSEVVDGFDWDLTPVSASGLEMQVWYPQRGSDRGVVLEYGGLVAGATLEINPADYANAIRMNGDANATPPVAAVERAAADLAGRPEGRWDKTYGDTGLTTQAALDERADWQIAQSQIVQPVVTLTLKQGAWDGPDHIWVGDSVRVVVVSGGTFVNEIMRVYEIAFTLGDNGSEAVQVTLGGPKPDPRRIPSLLGRRLANLERR
ncbi:MAG: hypothetical protein JWO67_7202 [Streptosporangiaceae bacterium]|nr:hypothetical protein [Streptosporangiaceae bacterium]